MLINELLSGYIDSVSLSFGIALTDKPHPPEKLAEKQSADGDKPPAGTPITSKDANRLQQLQERREALATARLTQDPNNGLRIDTGNGRVVEDARPITGRTVEQAPQIQDRDYKPQNLNDHTFALGVNRQELHDTRTPAEKLQEFMAAAAKRASDPEGWKAWAQSEINKFAGIGTGLNEAKEETKKAVAAGWKALTDGTVLEFLSHPDAINRPVFKVVADAFEAMGKDPNAVNHAFEKLGKLVVKASEQYSSLSDYEKGRVIGNVMFAMINPEGDLKDAAAAGKIATHLDTAVKQTIDQALKAAEHAAETSPELAQQTKQMLLDYIKSKGLSASELEKTGEIPKGYFDSLAGSGGSWEVLNERPSADVIQQLTPDSCVSACGEMLTNGAIKQDKLIHELRLYWPEELRSDSMLANIQWLAKELGPGWKGGFVDTMPTKAENLDLILGRHQIWCAELHEGGKAAHAVVVDGVDASGNICIRDPYHGTKYEMTREQFLKYWNSRAVIRC